MTETLISSPVLILVVILLRTVFKGRINNRARYALWLIVAARLLIPFDLAESSVSVMNLFGRASGISETTGISEIPEISQAPRETVNTSDTAELLPARAVSGNELLCTAECTDKTVSSNAKAITCGEDHK